VRPLHGMRGFRSPESARLWVALHAAGNVTLFINRGRRRRDAATFLIAASGAIIAMEWGAKISPQDPCVVCDNSVE